MQGKIMKTTIIITLILTLFTLNSFATENNNSTDLNNTQDLNISNEENITEENITIEVNTDNCVGCHGLNFEKTAMGMSNIVSDMTKEYIEATLFNYKYNSVEGNMNPLMSWQTAKLTDDEIKAIAQKLGK
jgi:cytochrome c553